MKPVLCVNIRSISDNGTTLERTVAPLDIALEDNEVECMGPLQVHAGIQMVDQNLLIKAVVNGRYRYNCGHCLEPIEREREDTFDLILDVDPAVDVVDFGDDVRQELAILFTNMIMVRETENGRCTDCGEAVKFAPTSKAPDEASLQRKIDI